MPRPSTNCGARCVWLHRRFALAPAPGLNIGVNEGEAGGGSEPDHLHVHVVPRWNADTNFMTAIAETRVLPMTLRDTWARLREAWPESLPFPT
ncbi:MAG: hypothetical protein R2710_30315 [Acidimicrobiales bacterium]